MMADLPQSPSFLQKNKTMESPDKGVIVEEEEVIKEEEKVVVVKVEEEEKNTGPVLEAKIVYILMSKDHRISRNRRAEWFFSRFNTVFSLPKDHLISLALDEGADFYVVSAIPKDPPPDWTPQTRHAFRYKITTKTVVTYLSRRYRIVYCIDVSPSVAAVDIQAGTVIFDGVFQALRASLDGLMRPFYIPGSTIVFQPKIFITVITHSPFVTSINNEVILQGKLLGPSTYNNILQTVFQELHVIENKMATMTETLVKTVNARRARQKAKMEKEKTPSGDSKSGIQPFKSSVSSDFSLVDLLKQALIALSLLPENSSSGLVILTDGVVSVPDGRYLDIILSQLRYNTVSCSFIQLSSPFHPHLCHGVLPYVDLMKFIATATFGSFMTEAPEMTSSSEAITEMNVYHLSFLAWSFQNSDNIQAETHLPASIKPGEWFIKNKCFFTIRDMPIVKKLQFESTLAVDYMKVLSCRLREGFMIKDINLNDECKYEITLTLPWKFLIHLEYVVITDQTPDSPTECIFSLEGPYDFLHDVTCLAARSFPSIYRQLMVNRFWATRKNLSESDRLLVHLNSFSSNQAFYSIPDSLRNGVPLFYFSSNSTVPQLQSNDFPYPQFSQFWKPVCMLDTNVWQKWMHTHRIGVILEHDHPLPKHLHHPNPAGRFQVILCRQAVMALNTLLKNSSSFVLVENHSYVTLMYNNEDDKSAPFSFYIIRVTSKPPYVVLRLAFLVGTPGNLRHKTVSSLIEKIGVLTFPQRLKVPPRWRFPSGNSTNSSDQANKASWSDMPCCILMNKPIEKILIRYEKVPDNYCEVLMPQNTYDTPSDPKSPNASQQSTFGFKRTNPTAPGGTPTIMVPEMFNTVARYLNHKRWIWYFPKCVLPDFEVKDASEILTVITKMRLQEGFRFAYSSSGTVSMVFEVQMQNRTNVPTHELDSTSEHKFVEETYLTPCVLQFVMFPPTTSLTPHFDDDIETPEENKDIFLVTESWIEPQCGELTGCKFDLLNGLQFSQIADKIFEINKECVLTLGAFDYLKGFPKSNYMDKKGKAGRLRAIAGANSMEENNTTLIPFEFELGRVLPKCSQTEMLFSMFFQDLGHAFSVEGKNEFVPYHERANETLYNSWTESLADVHDKEIMIDSRYFASLLTMVLSREDVTKTGKDSRFNSDDLPAWKCFVKSVDPSQQLITLVPKTLRDTKLFFLIVEKCKCVITAAEAKSKIEGPFLTIPQSQVGTELFSTTTKLRQRKISEPNACQKSAATCLVTHLSLDNPCPSVGRKRIRALSGGESAPVLKKAFTVDSSLHDSLAQSFFEETTSKYVVPKNKYTIVEDLNLSFSSHSETAEASHSFSNSECIDQFHVADHESKSMIGSMTMPLFMYDCSLSTLRSHLIYRGTQEVPDRCLDFRIFNVPDEGGRMKTSIEVEEAPPETPVETVEALDASVPAAESSSTECPIPDPKKPPDESEFTSVKLEEYCKNLQLSYRKSFIKSVFHSLQLGYYISTEDLKAVINVCHKNIITADISEFLKNICDHEQLDDACKTSATIRSFIQKKFKDILTKIFNYTKVDSDFFYYKSNRLHYSHENVFCDYGQYLPFMDFDDDKKRDSESFRETDQWNSSCDVFNFSDMTYGRRESESTNVEPTPPLFMLLKCTSTTENSSKTFAISDLPVCIDDYDPSLRVEIDNFTDDSNFWNTKVELVFLTMPNDSMEESAVSNFTNFHECQNISMAQVEALDTMLKEIKWLLNDEITSLRSNSLSLTTNMLEEIASHVEESSAKLGCFHQCIPLQFVENSAQGYQKFVGQFDNLWLPGFAFKKLENWWYLVGSTSSKKIIDFERDSDSDIMDTERSDDLSRQSIDESDGSTTCTTSISEIELSVESRLPYWILFKVDRENVFAYCHCRYDEDDSIPLNQCIETRGIILAEIARLIRIVNQDLLLQSLHDTRMCSNLLEPDTNRSGLDESLSSKNYDDGPRSELDMDSTTNTNNVAVFACDVVWETTFKLHPRLKSGPGKSAFSRGMQILRSTLMAFEVGNRENMFVYRNSLGNVFYLRLYRVIETYDEMMGVDCPSENPSPRSSISSRSRMHHPSADSNKDDPPIILREALNSLIGRTTPTEGIVLLKVHGVTEAGNEIKEQLIQSLRNKLDDAVLDVLSVTLDRNPHCKLTPEDVHFIQKPLSPPDALVRFTTGRFVKLLLSPFAFFLHQNLLQFLNIPKYTKTEFHFQDYHRVSENRFRTELEEHNVYLYNQSPGGTGSRGVACVSVALVDRNGGLLRCADWKRPWNFQFSLAMSELLTFIETDEIVNDTQTSDIILELCVWKQGRINLDILKNNFLSAIKHGGWDLAMEYQILTPSLFSPAAMEDQDTIERNKDLIMELKNSACGSPVTLPCVSDRLLRRRNSSAITLGKVVDQYDEPRERSWSYTVRRQSPYAPPIRLDIPSLESFSSRNSLRGSTASTETIRSGFDYVSTRRTIIEDIDKLHPNYSSKFKKWCNIGVPLNLPSLRVENIKFKPQHYLDETIEEVIKIIHTISPDNSTAQFWRLNKDMREFLTIGKKIRPEYESLLHKVSHDVDSFKAHEGKLASLDKKDEAEYPEELLKLFTTRECFQPSSKPSSCILIARNLSHWESCVYNKKHLGMAFNSSDLIKNLHKFYPLMSEPINFCDDKSSLNADKLKFPTKNGLLSLLGETCEESCLQSTLVPRQRFLLAFVSKQSVEFIFYNWAKEASDKIIDQTKILATWSRCRWDLMSSILLQKSGIFYNQPFLKDPIVATSMAHVPPTTGIQDIVRNCYPPKYVAVADRITGKNFAESRSQISELYRNLHHTHLLNLHDDEIQFTPISIHGEQLINLVEQGRNDVESALFRYWLSRGPSASNVIGKDAIEALKQTARMIHYCMTPIFFLPRWRTAISLTRDSSSGIFKRARLSESNLPVISDERERPRHASESSYRSVMSKGPKPPILPIWSLWKRLQSEKYKDEDPDIVGMSSRSPKRVSDSWHSNQCNAYIQEYMQYLQTLGFIPAQGNSNAKKQSVLTSDNWTQSYVGRLERMRRMSDGSVLSVDSDKNSQSHSPNGNHSKVQADTEEKVFYLQKSLPGGIILLEVGFIEPFSYCKIHALEVHRIQGKKFAQRAATSHNTIGFVDECDKMKVLMHLHSFAYDFHLRSIQNHICGKHIIKQGYHVTKFLDDFISYYCKGPNFARNTVHIGILSLQNISSPSHIMFDYILSHNKKYEMTVLRMNQVGSMPGYGYDDAALVYTLTKRVAYRESEDESHLGEFEMSLVISHDVLSVGRMYNTDPSVLKIKYYIVLTSRRELYPNLSGDLNCGKLFPVCAPQPLSDFSIRKDRKSFDNGQQLSENEVETRSCGNQSEMSESSTHNNVIREEKVHYMGYFSSHEQMMQEILKEQTVWAENFIRSMVEAAAVDCRRDLLWQRLQLGGKQHARNASDKDELTLRETVGVLTFWEFSELLELIHVQPLRDLDPQLKILLNQPINFFHTLIKLLSNVTKYEHRYFVAPDGKIHQLVIFNPNVNKSAVLIEINLIKSSNDISILYKDNLDGIMDEFPHELNQEILNLIETAIGACCYCNWINCL